MDHMHIIGGAGTDSLIDTGDAVKAVPIVAQAVAWFAGWHLPELVTALTAMYLSCLIIQFIYRFYRWQEETRYARYIARSNRRNAKISPPDRDTTSDGG
jgi:hypothetical protein